MRRYVGSIYRSTHTHPHPQTKCTWKTYGANLPTLLKRENTCTHTNPVTHPDLPHLWIQLLKKLQMEGCNILTPSHHNPSVSISFLFSLWPAFSPLYLLHPSIPREARKADNHCPLSQHALHLTADAGASDPCTSLWLLSNWQPQLQRSFPHLHTGPKKISAAA